MAEASLSCPVPLPQSPVVPFLEIPTAGSSEDPHPGRKSCPGPRREERGGEEVCQRVAGTCKWRPPEALHTALNGRALGPDQGLR